MKKPITIAVVGAPASGKSTTAAMLYAELMKLGLPARLVMEQATAHLGAGGKIETVEDQMNVTHQQMHSELLAMGQNFNPIICDGAVWLGEIYMNMILAKHPEFDRTEALPKLTSVLHYFEVMKQYKYGKAYDFLIFCPLIDDQDHINAHRIHDNQQSEKIGMEVLAIVQNASPIALDAYRLSSKIDKRDAEIRTIAKQIYNHIQGIIQQEPDIVSLDRVANA